MTQDEVKQVAMFILAEIQPEWLTESQVCARLQVSDNWVRNNRSKIGGRLLPGSKKGWRYRRAAVDAVLIDPF